MADRYAGGVKAGSTNVSGSCVLRKTQDNTEQTGKVAADVTISYWRQGGVNTVVSAVDLGAVSSPWQAGGFIAVDDAIKPGLYRVDWPDATWATGADWVIISVQCAGCYEFYERLNLETVGASELLAFAEALLPHPPTPGPPAPGGSGLIPNSLTYSFASGDDMLLYYDKRTIADLLSDVGTRTGGSPIPDDTQLVNHPKMLAALNYGAGLIEAACVRADRYKPADLGALNGNSRALLVGMNCDLAMGRLFWRRPDKGEPPASCRIALEMLEALANGERVFSFVQTEDAGLPYLQVMGPQDVRDQGFMSVQASRFFGTRGDESPPYAPGSP